MLVFSFSITLLKHFGGDGALPEELRLAVGAAKDGFREEDRVTGDDIAGAVQWII